MFRVSVTIEIGRPDGNREQVSELQILTRESWRRVKALVRKRDDATCKYCGRFAPDGEPDHVVSLSRGGTDALDNLAWACAACNSSKGNKTLQEWEATKRPAPILSDLPYTVEELVAMTDEEQAEVFKRYPPAHPIEIKVVSPDDPEMAQCLADVRSQLYLEACDDD